MTQNYYAGIREDFGNMIDEIGQTCTVILPVRTVDTWGNLTNADYTQTGQTFSEVIWVRPINELLEIQGIGQLEKTDLRFVAKYNTHIVNEAKIVVNGINYYVISIDLPQPEGNITNIVGYAKREVT